MLVVMLTVILTVILTAIATSAHEGATLFAHATAETVSAAADTAADAPAVGHSNACADVASLARANYWSHARILPTRFLCGSRQRRWYCGSLQLHTLPRRLFHGVGRAVRVQRLRPGEDRSGNGFFVLRGLRSGNNCRRGRRNWVHGL